MRCPSDRSRPLRNGQKAFTGWRCVVIASAFLFVSVSGPARAQKTDIIALKRGSHIIGEIKDLQNGKLTLGTWAMSTVYIEWPKVLNITTDKQFEILLIGGARFFGSVKAVADSGLVVIKYGTQTVEVETSAIVDMKWIKPTFWQALDGSIDVGADFTQQNAKTDLSLTTTVSYKKSLNDYRLKIDGAFSQQDSISDISRLNSSFRYAREWRKRVVFVTSLQGERNSQLDLEFRTTFTGGIGLFLYRTNKENLLVGVGLAYAREKYVDEDAANTLPAFIASEFQYFLWGRRDKELSVGLMVLPLLNGDSRWRLQFTSSMKWEIAHNLYINFSINEDYDSNPPAESANKNAFSVTTSLGWNF